MIWAEALPTMVTLLKTVLVIPWLLLVVSWVEVAIVVVLVLVEVEVVVVTVVVKVDDWERGVVIVGVVVAIDEVADWGIRAVTAAV